MNGLTDFQEMFVNHYVISLNGAQSAKKAGSKAKNYNTLCAVASELLSNPKVRKEIDRRLAQNGLTADETLSRLAMLARGNIADYSEIKSQEDLADHPQAYAVKEFEVKDDEVKIKLEDRKYALDTFVKLHKIIDNPIDDAALALKAWIEAQAKDNP